MKNTDNKSILEKIKQELNKIDYIVAAYVFGSILEGKIFNDIDILVLIENNNNNFYDFKIITKLADSLNISSDKIDLVFFDLDKTDPLVLINAVKGKLIKNTKNDLLTDKLEELSKYFLINESYLYHRKIYLQELLT